MTFPKLITQSEGLQKIPHPEDIGLDIAIKDFFEKYGMQITYGTVHDVREFVYGEDGSRVLSFAREIIEYPETDIETIISRQEILQEFMGNSELIDLILNYKIEVYPQKTGGPLVWHFNSVAERTKKYFDYIDKLSQLIPESSNSNLQTFRQHAIEFLSEEKMQELNMILEDISHPAEIILKTNFKAINNPKAMDGIEYESGKILVEGTFMSGAKIEGIDDPEDSFNRQNYGTQNHLLFKAALDQIKATKGEDLRNKSINLEVVIDQKERTVKGKAKYKKMPRTIEVPFEVSPEEWDMQHNSPPEVRAHFLKSEPRLLWPFHDVSDALNYAKYDSIIEGIGTDIKEFEEAVVELRYLATFANYFNKLKELGKDATLPTFEPLGSHKINAERLINPNLINQEGIEEIIVNQAFTSPDQNIHLITGPNNNGKTTYMNAVAIAQAMAQAGLMVLAKDGAVFSLVDNVFTHYIREGDFSAGESRYAHELSRIKEIFQTVTPNSFVLMDEPCTGTAPRDGRIQADTVFRALERVGPTTFVSTHYHELADTAEELSYAANLHCVAHKEGDSLVYTYIIKEGASKESNGLVLAKKMGVDKEGIDAILQQRVEKEGLKLR